MDDGHTAGAELALEGVATGKRAKVGRLAVSYNSSLNSIRLRRIARQYPGFGGAAM
jgi:hypothetical protein